VYAFDLSRAAGLPGSSPLNRNRIADFLAPRPGGGQADDFLRGALQRFEDRCYSYTHVDNGLLIHCSWLIPEQPAAPAGAETLAAIGIPAGSCVLETSPSDSAIGGSGLQRAALCQMLRDAAQLGRHEFALIGVMSDDLALRQVVEELGFSYRYSCFDSRRLLRTRRWRSQPAEPAPATA
jgi:hypothetical protein